MQLICGGLPCHKLGGFRAHESPGIRIKCMC